MTNKTNLDKNYYYNADGTIDEISVALDDCISQSSYVILKNKYDSAENLYYAYIDEMTIRISVSDDNFITSFGAVGEINDKNLFSIITESFPDSSPKERLMQLVKENEFPLVRGTVEYLQSSIFYNENHKPSDAKSKHIILFIGEDENDYYFVDSPGLISYENYNYYDDNIDVGILEKDDFNKYIEDGSEIIYYKYNIDVIRSAVNNVEDALIRTYENYNKEHITENNIIHYFGIEAINKFFELIKTNKISLHDLTVSKDRDIMSYLSWKISVIKGRRKLNKIYLEEKTDNLSAKKLVQDLELLIHDWELFHSLLYKSYMANTSFDNNIFEMADKLTDNEKKMNEDLRCYLNR